jgi:two-component system CheB/CheR fusion protein
VVYAPLVLTLFSSTARGPIRKRSVEFAALLVVLTGIGLFAFGGTPISASGYPAPDYAVLPVLIWAALRFGVLGTSISIVVSSTIAVLGTVKGFGPFTSGSTHENLIALQLYMFVAAITGLVIAVTKAGRDRAENSLHRSEQRYRSLVMTSSQVVWTTSATGDVVEALPSWTAFTGQPAAETLGRGWVKKLHPDDVEQASRLWERSLATGTPHENEFRVLGADGVYKYVHAHAVPVLEPNGRVREWVGTLTDITARKQAGIQMEEENRRKDEFLAMLAHELRNPLAAIAGALEVIRTTRGEEARLERMGEMTSRQIQHMSRILDDLLDVSRITRGVVELNKQAGDLTVLAQKCLQHARLSAEKKSLAVTTNLSQEPLPVFVDVTRIEQVIINLINNAVKFTPAGGEIHISTGKEGEFAIFTVRDSGRGIEKTFLPQIFDLFTQADRSLARSEGGLGIGLTLVRSLVLMHGGQVQARSEGAGCGSTFTVRLPLSLQPAAESSPQWTATSTGRQKILIIEDNVDSAEALSIIVNLMGHETYIAYDGVQGIEKFHEVKPNVVLLDIGLPNLNGYEVAERLRAENPKLKLIALTGYGARADRERTLRVGFDVHLVKPVDVAVLKNLLM